MRTYKTFDPKKYNREYYLKNKDKRRAYHRKWVLANMQKHVETTRQWRKDNPEKYKAHGKISGLLQNKKLFKKPCETCKEEKVHAHHPDYSKPTQIIWLCLKHHQAIHRELKVNRAQL